MKKTLKKIKEKSGEKFIIMIEKIIDHKFFKPVATSVVASFVAFNCFALFNNYIFDYHEKKSREKSATPIKINILDNGKIIDFTDAQIAEYRIKSGDNLLKMLTQIGAEEKDVLAILSATKKVFNLQELKAGDDIFVKYSLSLNNAEELAASKKIIIKELRITPSPGVEISITRDENNNYSAEEKRQKLTRQIVRYAAEIKDGLYIDGTNAGISPTSMMNMIGLYAYDIDFQRDLHDGDKFEMLVEGYYNESGRKVKDGNVLFSAIALKDRKIEIYGHMVNTHLEYFDGTGNSVRKSLLRTPVNGARISSGFGFRKHPILGYSKLHKGIDFAAPSGTPIFAAGNGVVTFMGVHGGYGNFVRIKHNQDYETQYGHASKFAKKFHVGSKVKQGDVVAYVGSTGRSTGPHLHFEIVYRGSAINPSKVKAVSGIKLAGKELEKFRLTKNEIDNYRKKIPNEIASQ